MEHEDQSFLCICADGTCALSPVGSDGNHACEVLDKIRGLVSNFNPDRSSASQDAQTIVCTFSEAVKLVDSMKMEITNLSPISQKASTKRLAEHVSALHTIRGHFLSKLAKNPRTADTFVPSASLDDDECAGGDDERKEERPGDTSGEFVAGDFICADEDDQIESAKRKHKHKQDKEDEKLIVGKSERKAGDAKKSAAVSAAVDSKDSKEEPTQTIRVRKRVGAMTQTERNAFVAALLELKRQPSLEGQDNRYDDFVALHRRSMMPAPGTKGWAHQGPAFLPWHRVYLRRLEIELQEINPAVTIPYWDWTSRLSSDFPLVSSFLGGTGDAWDDYQVRSSNPFGDVNRWQINVKVDNFEPDRLRREFDPTALYSLPTRTDVNNCLLRSVYDTSPWNTSSQRSFRNQLEGWTGPGLHNAVHVWVGGTMAQMNSPNDPVFFLHHANVDRIWRRWQRTYPRSPYLPTDSASSTLRGHRLNDPMMPWMGSVTPNSTLNSRNMGYRYDDEPAWECPKEFHLKDIPEPDVPPGFKWPPPYGRAALTDTTTTLSLDPAPSTSADVTAKATAVVPEKEEQGVIKT